MSGRCARAPRFSHSARRRPPPLGHPTAQSVRGARVKLNKQTTHQPRCQSRTAAVIILIIIAVVVVVAGRADRTTRIITSSSASICARAPAMPNVPYLQLHLVAHPAGHQRAGRQSKAPVYECACGGNLSGLDCRPRPMISLYRCRLAAVGPIDGDKEKTHKHNLLVRFGALIVVCRFASSAGASVESSPICRGGSRLAAARARELR